MAWVIVIISSWILFCSVFGLLGTFFHIRGVYLMSGNRIGGFDNLNAFVAFRREELHRCLVEKQCPLDANRWHMRMDKLSWGLIKKWEKFGAVLGLWIQLTSTLFLVFPLF